MGKKGNDGVNRGEIERLRGGVDGHDSKGRRTKKYADARPQSCTDPDTFPAIKQEETAHPWSTNYGKEFVQKPNHTSKVIESG